jgi:hypothetical protein
MFQNLVIEISDDEDDIEGGQGAGLEIYEK